MNSNALNVYKQTRVKTAGQAQLIIMLYDEAIKQIDTAVNEFNKQNKKLDAVNNAIIKAQDIITELMVSLDFEKGGEIAKNLFSLYMFFNQQLIDANIKKDLKPLSEIRAFLAELRGAWSTIENKVQTADPSNHVGVNIAG